MLEYFFFWKRSLDIQKISREDMQHTCLNSIAGASKRFNRISDLILNESIGGEHKSHDDMTPIT